jgi:hypothetical protein
MKATEKRVSWSVLNVEDDTQRVDFLAYPSGAKDANGAWKSYVTHRDGDIRSTGMHVTHDSKTVAEAYARELLSTMIGDGWAERAGKGADAFTTLPVRRKAAAGGAAGAPAAGAGETTIGENGKLKAQLVTR